jgi:flagellar export protein FliJ
MAFRFPLEVVFHFRQSIEHQQELRLLAANQQVARVRNLIEQLDERVRQLQETCIHDLAAGITAAELRFALAKEASLLEQRSQIERELSRLQNLRDQQQRVFQQARRERETFESLRDQQQHKYDRDVARREQRQLDDLFLLRQTYLRRG